MSEIAPPILSVFDYAWQRLNVRLAGLDDDEYFWEPTADCWSLRQDQSGEWSLDGEGGGGPAPDPAPLTTIAWRICHVGVLALGGFTERRFPELAQADAGLPVRASDALELLDRCYRGWRQGMESLADAEWWQPLGADWGPYAEDTTLDLALHVLDELIHHGAEISLLRDLYAHREELTGAR